MHLSSPVLSIRSKLTAVILAGVLLPLGVGLGIVATYELRTQRENLLSETRVVAQLASEYSASAMAFEDRRAAEESLNTLAGRDDIMFAALYDEQGVRFVDWRRKGADRAPDALIRPGPPAGSTADFIDTFYPVVRGESPLGTLHLRTSTARVSEIRTRYLWSVAAVAIGLGVFALAFAIALQRVVSRPLLALSDVTRHISQHGDYSVRVAKRSEDEIGQLTEAFNTMLHEIERRQAQLADAQAELVEKERLAAVGELAAVMAHEVRNPLCVVFSALEALRKRLGTTEGDVSALINMAGEEAERLNRMVDDLLDFARPHTPRRQPTAIDRVIASAVEVATCSAPTHSIRFRAVIDPRLPQVPIDERMIRQVLINLLINAVQAMPAGGEISINAGATQHEGRPFARIEVVDDGPGMAEDITERVFQPFFTTKATGTGLGLAVVRRFVEAHSGQVAVRTVKGDGSTFTMLLPLEAQVTEPATPRN